MILFGRDFEFNGKTLSSFGGKVTRVDGDTSITSGLSRTIQKGETSLYRRRPNHFGTVYDDVLTFDVSIIKGSYTDVTSNSSLFVRDEVRRINRWLTSPTLPKKIRSFNFAENNNEVYSYYGVVTNIAYDAVCLSDGDFVPQIITATFQCDSPYAWKENQLKLKDGEHTIYVDDDELEGYVYPLIKITPNNTSGVGTRRFMWRNRDDGNKEINLTIASNRIVYLDCQKMKIYDEIGLVTFEDMGIGELGEFYLPRLVSGNNRIVISGNVNVDVSWEEAKKVGVL